MPIFLNQDEHLLLVSRFREGAGRIFFWLKMILKSSSCLQLTVIKKNKTESGSFDHFAVRAHGKLSFPELNNAGENCEKFPRAQSVK